MFKGKNPEKSESTTQEDCIVLFFVCFFFFFFFFLVVFSVLLFMSSNIMNVPSRGRGKNCGFAFLLFTGSCLLYMTLQGTARYFLAPQIE